LVETIPTDTYRGSDPAYRNFPDDFDAEIEDRYAIVSQHYHDVLDI
jgi:hypothetical protein